MGLSPLPCNMQLSAVLCNLALSPRGFLKQWQAAVAPLKSEDHVDIDALKPWFSANKVPAQVMEGGTLLVVSLLPLPYSIKIEAVLAQAMRKRGYKVAVLTNIASHSLVQAYHGELGGYKVYVLENFLRLRHFRTFRGVLDPLLHAEGDLAQAVKAFRYRDAYIGLHVLATLSSEVTDGNPFREEPDHRRLRRMLRRSIHLMHAASAAISAISPSLILSIEKGFVGTAEIFYAALNAHVDYVQWTGCHEPNAIMMKRYNWSNCREHPFSISAQAWEWICDLPWSEAFERDVMRQFERGYKEGVWFKYKNLSSNQDQSDKRELMARLSLDTTKKTAIIYSHILNDANLFYGQDLFDGGYEEWLVETVRAAAGNPAVNWVLKLHPSNVYRNAKLGYTGEYGEILALKQAFGKVPDFLRVVYPEEKVSPFSFFQITDYGVTVRGTVGLELPCFGIPTLTAGTGRYAGKGFTVDSSSREEYLAKIRAIHEIPPLTTEQIQKGQRYAYFVFRARPARYGDMFSDVYNFPLNHPRYRDIALGGKPLDKLLDHPQMQKIVDFLCSDDEDFLDFSVA